MKEYIKYLKYVRNHRKNIKRACNYWLKEWSDEYKYNDNRKKEIKQILRKIKITHDLSKYNPIEFIPYAKNFYGEKKCNNCEKEYSCKLLNGIVDIDNCRYFRAIGWNKAWEHHFRNNKHHWNYWVYDWNKYGTELESPLLKYCKLDKPIEMDKKYILEMIIDWTAMGYQFGNTPQEYYLNNYNNIKLNRDTRYILEIWLGLLHYSEPIDYYDVEYWMTIKELKMNGYNLNKLLRPKHCNITLNFNKYDDMIKIDDGNID